METSLVGLGGALIGIVLGHFLTRSAQHEQWLRDNRNQEYRELLTALSDTFLNIVKHGTEPQTHSPNIAGASIDGFKVLHDRIFIAEEIKGAAIMGKWLAIVDLCSTRGGLPQAMNRFSALKDELVRMALKAPSPFGFAERVKWWKHKHDAASSQNTPSDPSAPPT